MQSARVQEVSARSAGFAVGAFSLVVLLFLNGCAKQRPVMAPPPPVSRPTTPPPVLRPPSTSAPAAKPPLRAGPVSLPAPGQPPEEPRSAESLTLRPPAGCIPDEVEPWFRCRHESPNSRGLTYYLFLPQGAPAAEPLPLLTVLHGSSARGPGDGKPLAGGNSSAALFAIRDEIQALHPSIVLVPQAAPSRGETWVRRWRAPEPGDRRPKEALVLVMEIIEALRAHYPVDGRRLYLTGQSMGGFGAWLAYTRYPGFFAAIVPVCGGGDPSAVVPNPTAVWAFHGARDRVVSVRRSRQMLEAIRSAGGQPLFREFPNLGHEIFNETYDEPGLADWIFAQRLPE